MEPLGKGHEMNKALIKQNVLRIINECHEAADDDALLFAKYWERFDGWSNNVSLYDNLRRVTRPETITRRRRELHEAGLIQYSDEALKDRTTAFNNELEQHSDNKAVSWLYDED